MKQETFYKDGNGVYRPVDRKSGHTKSLVLLSLLVAFLVACYINSWFGIYLAGIP